MVLLTILSARNSFTRLHCFLLIFRCTSIALIVLQEKTSLRTPLKNSPPDPEKDSLSDQAQSFGVIKQEKAIEEEDQELEEKVMCNLDLKG